MRIKLLMLLCAITVLSGCRVQYPMQVHMSGHSAIQPARARVNINDAPAMVAVTAPPVMHASASESEVPLATNPSAQIENASSIMPLLQAKLQSSKAFKKLSPARRQKVMAAVDKVKTKFERRVYRVGGMPLAIASFVSSILAIVSLCLTGVAPPMLIVSIFLSLAAIILGGIALHRAEGRAAKALAITGIVLGCLTFLIDILLIVFVITLLLPILLL